MGSFLFSKTGLFLIVIAAVVVLDIKEHGSYKASKTGKFLENSGIRRFLNTAFIKFRTFCQRMYRWIQKTWPTHAPTIRANIFSFLVSVRDTIFMVALQLWSNFKLLGSYLLDMKSILVRKVESYAPGLPKRLGVWFGQAWSFASESLMSAARLVLQYLYLTAEWLRDNVFIGKLSPKNLQRYTMEAVNTTRTLAAQSFAWLNRKIAAVSTAS